VFRVWQDRYKSMQVEKSAFEDQSEENAM